MKRIFRLLFILFLPLFFLACKSKNANTVQTSVNIAIQPSAAFIPLYIARYQGFIEEALKPSGVKVNWQDFEAGPPINESLFAEMSDIGLLGDVPAVSALAGAVQMKIVGVPARGPDAYAMLARKSDTYLNSVKDMKGKRIATVFGSTGHNLVTKLLEQNNLTFEDIELVSIKAGDAENALISDLADAVVIWEPNVMRLIDQGTAKIVAKGSDTDLRGTNAFVVRSEYLLNNKDVIKVILEQYKRAVELIPTLDDETLTKLAGVLKLTGAQVREISKKYDFSVTVSDKDIASLEDTVNFLVQIGNLQTSYDLASKIENLL